MNQYPTFTLKNLLFLVIVVVINSGIESYIHIGFVIGGFIICAIIFFLVLYFFIGSETKKNHQEEQYTTSPPIPDKIQSQIQDFKVLRQNLEKNYQNLKDTLESDISNIGTTYTETYNIYERLGGFQRDITETTDRLMQILPEDISLISEFGDKDVFFEFLENVIKEMDTMKAMSESMTLIVKKWMVYHSIEASQEKTRLENILQKGSDTISSAMMSLSEMNTRLIEMKQDTETKNILQEVRI